MLAPETKDYKWIENRMSSLADYSLMSDVNIY